VPTPGFPPGTLTEGFPAWIDAIEGEYAHYTVHVVRGLSPADALETFGARPASFMTCVLPGAPADGRPRLRKRCSGSPAVRPYR
jgi:hypothetical protein